MQQKYVNGFCDIQSHAVEKNIDAGVRYLQLFSHNPLQTISQMRKANLCGRVVIDAAAALNQQNLKQILNQNFDIAVYVDILQLEESDLEKISFLNLPVVIPLFENLYRTGQISAKYDCSPAKFIEDMGFLDRDCTIIGGVYADKDDLQLLGSYGAKIVLCPTTLAKSGATFANIPLMQKYGLKVMLGSGSEETIDFEREIDFLYLTQLALLENPQAISKNQIINLATGENYDNQ